MKIASLSLTVLAACATSTTTPTPVSEGRCNSVDAVQLVGRQATVELGAEALAKTGARALRWIRPGMAVTMDFRADRLNIHIDAQNRVERITCG